MTLAGLISPLGIAAMIIIAAGALVMTRLVMRRRHPAPEEAPPAPSSPSTAVVSSQGQPSPPANDLQQRQPIVLDVKLSHFQGMPFAEIGALEIQDVRLSKKQSVLISLVPGSQPTGRTERQESTPAQRPRPPTTGLLQFACTTCPEKFATEEEALRHEVDNLYHVVRAAPLAVSQ